MSDRDWQLEITKALAEVQTSQTALHTKLDEAIARTDRRLEKLEAVVYGNGHRGLAEDIRNIKGKWAAAYTGMLLILNGLTTYGIHVFCK